MTTKSPKEVSEVLLGSDTADLGCRVYGYYSKGKAVITRVEPNPSETNEAPVESVSQPKAVDGYLKEFDEFSVAKRFPDYPLISINDYVSTLGEIKKLYLSSIERARREGYNTGFDMGSASVEVLTKKAIKKERQRVVEMIERMKKPKMGDLGYEVGDGIYGEAITDILSKIKEGK